MLDAWLYPTKVVKNVVLINLLDFNTFSDLLVFKNSQNQPDGLTDQALWTSIKILKFKSIKLMSPYLNSGYFCNTRIR